VLLVSLDTGIPSPSAGTDDLTPARLSLNATSVNPGPAASPNSHGHFSISVMSSTPSSPGNVRGVAGINWTSTVRVENLYTGGINLVQAINDALGFANLRASARGVPGRDPGEAWLSRTSTPAASTDYTQAQLEALLTSTEPMALYAVAAGNAGQSILINNVATGFSGGVARLSSP